MHRRVREGWGRARPDKLVHTLLLCTKVVKYISFVTGALVLTKTIDNNFFLELNQLIASNLGCLRMHTES